jgi:hypothetical protein
MSGPEIWMPTRTAIEAWRYSAGAGAPLQAVASILDVADVEALAIANDGVTAGAVVRHTAWGVAHIATGTRVETFRELADRPRNLAYVGETGGGAMFAGASPAALHLLEESQAPVTLPLAGLDAPVAIGPDAAFGSASAAVVVAKADRAIVSVRVDLSTRTTTTSSVSFPASIAGEPIVMRAGAEVRVYVQLLNDNLTWCVLSAGPSSVACTPANPSDGFSGAEVEGEHALELLTSYLDADATPDLVVPTKEGDIYFRSGARPADPAAATVRIGREIKEPSALLPGFFDAFGARGDLMAVPFEDGSITLISWATPPSAPAVTDALWTQPRKDAQRSAHLP